MKPPRHDQTDALEPTPSATRSVVSAIIPTFNSAAMLRDAIDSIRAQTRPVDEIIVVDDGSTDDTRDVCAQFAGVRYMHQENAGASAARNRGASIARGDWLAFLDADDTWEESKIEKQLAAIGNAPETDFCVTGASVWSPCDSSWHSYAWSGPVEPVYLQRRLLVRNIFTGLCSSMLIRRDAFEAVGGFAAGKCSEDRRIAIELLNRHRPLVLAEPLIRQRTGPAHFTNPERHRREMVALIEDYAPLFRRIDPRGLWRRRAVARVHERSGMHYLENGDVSAALYDLSLAAIHWPFQPNPWRAFINAAIGRLSHRSSGQQMMNQSPSR
jgi:glycosyltransferase involved in cell wall biosynthesis